MQQKQEELLRQQLEKEHEAEERRAAEERAEQRRVEVERMEQLCIQAERKFVQKSLEMQTFQRQKELEDEQRRKRCEEEVANKPKRHGWGYKTDRAAKRDFERYKARFMIPGGVSNVQPPCFVTWVVVVIVFNVTV